MPNEAVHLHAVNVSLECCARTTSRQDGPATHAHRSMMLFSASAAASTHSADCGGITTRIQTSNCVTSASCSASKNLEDGHCGPGACEDVFVQPTIQRGPQLVHLQKRGGNTGLCERKHRLRTSGRRHSRKLSMRKQAVVGHSKCKRIALGKYCECI